MKQRDRLWKKIEVKGPDECWPWRGSVYPDGRGRLRWNGKDGYPAPRAVLEDALGRPLRTSYLACHIIECSNPNCCNPAHLYEGTYSSNRFDVRDLKRTERQLI